MPASYLESITYYFISQLPQKWVHFGSVSSEGFAQEGSAPLLLGAVRSLQRKRTGGFPSELRFPWRASVRTANETSSGDASRAFGVARGGHGTWQLAYFLALYTRIIVRCTWSCVRNPWTLMQ